MKGEVGTNRSESAHEGPNRGELGEGLNRSELGDGEGPNRSELGDGEGPNRSELGDGEGPNRSELGDGEGPNRSELGDGEGPSRSELGDGGKSNSEVDNIKDSKEKLVHLLELPDLTPDDTSLKTEETKTTTTAPILLTNCEDSGQTSVHLPTPAKSCSLVTNRASIKSSPVSMQFPSASNVNSAPKQLSPLVIHNNLLTLPAPVSAHRRRSSPQLEAYSSEVPFKLSSVPDKHRRFAQDNMLKMVLDPHLTGPLPPSPNRRFR